MKTRIRDVRQSKGLTLQKLADRIRPTPTTAQTIGRLETGSRKMTLDWLEKIAAALECTTADLIEFGGEAEIPFAGTLTRPGRLAPAGAETLRLSPPSKAPVAIKIATKIGEFDIGDTLICETSTLPDFRDCLGKDCLVTTENGDRLYGRLIQGSKPGLFTVIAAADEGGVLYDQRLTAAARRSMLIRYY